MNLLLLIGIAVAAYWCFTQGPCLTWQLGAPRTQGITTAGTLIMPAGGFGTC